MSTSRAFAMLPGQGAPGGTAINRDVTFRNLRDLIQQYHLLKARGVLDEDPTLRKIKQTLTRWQEWAIAQDRKKQQDQMSADREALVPASFPVDDGTYNTVFNDFFDYEQYAIDHSEEPMDLDHESDQNQVTNKVSNMPSVNFTYFARKKSTGIPSKDSFSHPTIPYERSLLGTRSGEGVPVVVQLDHLLDHPRLRQHFGFLGPKGDLRMDPHRLFDVRTFLKDGTGLGVGGGGDWGSQKEAVQRALVAGFRRYLEKKAAPYKRT